MSVGLLISILIRVLAFGWSLLLLYRIRDWRMGFLSVMLALMALRQILTLESKYTSTTLTFSSLNTEWPGLIVSLMAFLSVYFLGKMLAQRKQTELDQERLIRNLESQNTELERFTYTISHDLKTPLVTINGFLGYLREDIRNDDSGKIERDLNKIEAAATGMAQSLEELLELSRVGRVVNPFEPVGLDELTELALTRVESQIRNFKVQLKVEPEMPQVYVDRSRLLEVLVILIDNAIKYRREETAAIVEIGCRIADDEVIYQVRDNGIGIDPEYFDYVFGLFNRLDASSPGSGIGLTLAKRIIELHRGRVWIESEGKDLGTSVSFALPRSMDRRA